MITFVDGIKHLYVPKLNEVGQNISLGINQWLTNGSQFFISTNHSQNDFQVFTYDSLDFLKPYAFDINRLSCASAESLKDIQRKDWQAKFIGWNITKFYYSAFFSAHCILKATGNNLSNIDNKALSKIRQITSALGYTYQNLNTGLYCISIDTVLNRFRFYKQPQYDDSHEGLWKFFLHFLINSKPSVYGQLPLSEAQNVVDKIEELIEALTNWNSQNGNWLSRVRNAVNYSQSYGTWFPYKEYLIEYDKIYSFMNMNKENPLLIDIASFKGRDILYFVRTCQLINAICNDILVDIEKKHPINKSFVTYGVRQFENLYT